MQPHVRRTALTAGLAAGLVTVLAGCGPSDDTAGPTGPATTTTTAPSTPAPGDDATTPGAGATGDAGVDGGTSGEGPGGSSGDEGAGDGLELARCATGDLALTVTAQDAAAGSRHVDLVLTNTGGDACWLQGWPGVSFVGGGDGEQVGASATLDRSSAHDTVTLDPGGTAHAPLTVSVAQNYPAESCSPVQPDGFRVYPPGSTESLYVPDADLEACASPDVTLLTVQALQPGS
ncbi:DUF4232 domain-containing protein [Cellulomonas sp. C5510]|nr:DUF4232 domain-containing protein [Cellulomonas sp. C5510]